MLIKFLNLKNKDTTCKELIKDSSWDVLDPKSWPDIIWKNASWQKQVIFHVGD